MFYKVLAILIAATLFQLNLYAEMPELPDAPSAVQPNVRSDLSKFADEQKKVRVTLNNSSFLTRKVQKIEDQSFLFVESKTDRTSQINFSDVMSVRKAGMGTGDVSPVYRYKRTRCRPRSLPRCDRAGGSASGASEGRKWIVETNNLVSGVAYLLKRQLTVGQWLSAVRGVQEGVWLSLDDPAPSLALPMMFFQKHHTLPASPMKCRQPEMQKS